MRTVTLCGSARFEAEFREANKQLGLRGWAVYALSTYPSDNGNQHEWYTGGEKVMLDLVHLGKILETGAILVVGNGYIGPSTAREILWADMLGKRLCWQAALPMDWDLVSRALMVPSDDHHRPSGLLEMARAVLASRQP